MDAHIRDLRYFVAVAEELSFTRAAEKLFVSQPALSKQIRGLEHSLRASLFVRDTRRVQLTAAGEALLQGARELLAGWEATVRTVAETAAAETKVLRVGTLTALGRSLYPGVMDDFLARQAGWRVELRSFGWADPTAGLADGTSDIAFVWFPLEVGGLSSEVLFSERRFVAMSSRHPLSKRESVSFSEIAAEPLAALPRGAGAQREFWLAIDARHGAAAPVGAEVESADETFEIVASGAAMVLLAEGNALVYVRPGVVCLPVEGLSPARLAVAWRDDSQSAAVTAFVQACLETVARRDLEVWPGADGELARHSQRAKTKARRAS